LHGVTSSASAWADVEPLLSDDFDVITPTAAGHRGGPTVNGAATISALVDHVERLLDDKGIAKPHIAGNSMGG
jgi:pimeloyl-ACP methyl ester carboxylesterase